MTSLSKYQLLMQEQRFNVLMPDNTTSMLTGGNLNDRDFGNLDCDDDGNFIIKTLSYRARLFGGSFRDILSNPEFYFRMDPTYFNKSILRLMEKRNRLLQKQSTSSVKVSPNKGMAFAVTQQQHESKKSKKKNSSKYRKSKKKLRQENRCKSCPQWKRERKVVQRKRGLSEYASSSTASRGDIVKCDIGCLNNCQCDTCIENFLLAFDCKVCLDRGCDDCLCEYCQNHGCPACQPDIYDCWCCGHGCEECRPDMYDCMNCGDVGCEQCTFGCWRCEDNGCRECDRW